MLRILLRKFFRDWRNLLPLAFVLLFILTAILAPVISPPQSEDDPAFNRSEGFSRTPIPPNEEFLLGTFPGNYDVFHTLIWGTRSALAFGLTVALSTALIGIGIGALSSITGGIVGRFGMRVTDAFMAFPSLAVIMLLTQLFTPLSRGFLVVEPNSFQQLMMDLNVQPVMVALILFSWMAYSRLTYVSIEQQRTLEYVEAARVIGLSNWRIFTRHILPNIVTPLLVLVTKDIGGMVILESAFVFIGVSHYTEWGSMIAQSKNWIIGPEGFTYWWTFIPVTLALILFSVSWQLLGQRINATVNPRSFSFLK